MPYVCPACHGDLTREDGDVRCRSCAAHFALIDGEIPDFAGSTTFFDDWWVQTPEQQERWLALEGPKEEAFQRGLTQRYLLPLQRRLGYAPGEVALLSAGCGLAADVEALNDAGYATWGIDCGNRVKLWSGRRHRDRLARADLAQLPFPDGAFDVVLALDVLEHIGVVGDTTRVHADCEAQRLAALRSLLRVTRPGGHVLLSGVNRRFPIDPFHVQGVRFVRFHSPWEPFLLSYGDLVRLSRATGLVDWVRPLPLRGFFSYTTLGRHAALRPFLRVLDWLLGGLPAAVYGSWLSFFTIALVHRRDQPPGPSQPDQPPGPSQPIALAAGGDAEPRDRVPLGTNDSSRR